MYNVVTLTTLAYRSAYCPQRYSTPWWGRLQERGSQHRQACRLAEWGYPTGVWSIKDNTFLQFLTVSTLFLLGHIAKILYSVECLIV